MRSELLQRWVTVRAASAITVITQDDEDWLDTSGASDIVAYVDIREFTFTGTQLFLYIESSPTRDENLFTQVAPPIALTSSFTPASTPIVARSTKGAASLNPLGRWLRWRLVGISPSATWDITFRVRIHRSHSQLFAPTQLSGCILWLRSDLGISSSVTTSILPSGLWLDQSTYANNAQQHGANNCAYSPGTPTQLPFVDPSNATACFFNQPATLNGPGSTSHTLFAVVNVPSSISTTMYIFAATVGGGKSTAFSLWADTGTLDARTTQAVGNGLDINVSTGLNFGSIAIYTTLVQMTAANTGTSLLYINGTEVAGASGNITTFTPGVPNQYCVFCEDSTGEVNFEGPAYEFILFNRALSTPELTVVHRYLGGRYGISSVP